MDNQKIYTIIQSLQKFYKLDANKKEAAILDNFVEALLVELNIPIETQINPDDVPVWILDHYSDLSNQ